MKTETPVLPKEGGSPPVGAAGAGEPAWVAVALLALLAVACCTPLLPPGWFQNQETIRPIARAFAAWQEMAAGDLYPRWIASGYLGKGMPLFNYYAPAFSFLVAYLHLLGVPLILAAKLVILGLFFLGALGTWLWARPHLGHHAALVAAVLYLFAPYHFVDLYVRGATAEFTALAAFPFLFLGIDALVDRLSVKGLAWLAVSSAAIVLSHFLAALMISPFAIAYAIARVVGRDAAWRRLATVAAGAAIGAALSAFYWLPALAENGALSAERLQASMNGYYWPFWHFLHPIQWLDPSWGFGTSVPDPEADGMSFQVGLLTVAAVLASLISLRALAKPRRGFLVLTLALGLLALMLTGTISGPLYEWARPLQLVQFPWRFLGPVTLFLAVAGAGFASALVERWTALGPAIASLVAALAVVLSAGQRAVERPTPLADEDRAIAAAIDADVWAKRFGNEHEFLPRDAPVEAAMTEPGGPFPYGIGVEVFDVKAGRQEVSFGVSSALGEAITIVPWHAFPGWKVRLDGRPWSLTPGPDGLLAFWVPQGGHVARVYFGTTPARVCGWLLALAGAATLLALALRERIVGRRARAGV